MDCSYHCRIKKELDLSGGIFYYRYERIKSVLYKVLIITVLIITGGLYAQGIDINYSYWTFNDIPLGQRVKLEPSVKIKNTGMLEREYEFSVFTGNIDYYSSFPSLRYVDLPEPIRIMPGEEYEIDIYLELPYVPSNFNQHWVLYLEVNSKANDWEPVSLSGIVKMLIETEAGYIQQQVAGLAPSVINLTPEIKEFNFWVANLSFLPESLEFSLSPPERVDFIDRIIGYNRTVDFVRLEKNSLTVRAGERLQVKGSTKLPPNYDNDPLEALILIREKSRDRREFIRVLLK